MGPHTLICAGGGGRHLSRQHLRFSAQEPHLGGMLDCMTLFPLFPDQNGKLQLKGDPFFLFFLRNIPSGAKQLWKRTGPTPTACKPSPSTCMAGSPSQNHTLEAFCITAKARRAGRRLRRMGAVEPNRLPSRSPAMSTFRSSAQRPRASSRRDRSASSEEPHAPHTREA